MLLLALRQAPAAGPLPFVMGMGTGLAPEDAPAAAGRSTEEYLSSSSICQGVEDDEQPMLCSTWQPVQWAGCQQAASRRARCLHEIATRDMQTRGDPSSHP